MIKVLLADDHPLILRGVNVLITSQDDMTVVGQEVDPASVLTAVGKFKPDVLVQDLSMQGEMSGLEVIRDVSANYPGTRIVVLSMHVAPSAVWEAMQQGALGYVTKLGDFDELVHAVREVHAGRRFIGAPLSEEEIEDYGRLARQRGGDSLASLTKRELEVLSMVAEGHTSNEIADLLNIGRRTVESHRANLSSKLGLRNQAELIRYAIDRGLVVPR